MSRATLISAATACAIAIAGCSSSGTDDGGGTPGPESCTATVTGAITATPQCQNLIASWTSDDSVTIVSFDTPDSGTTAVGSIDINGEPTTTTYTADNSGAFISVEQGDNQWIAGASIGSYSLVITSVKTTASDPQVRTYEVHGKLTVNMVGGDQSTITLTVNF